MYLYIERERESAFILLMPVKLDDDHGGRDHIYIYMRENSMNMILQCAYDMDWETGKSMNRML